MGAKNILRHIPVVLGVRMGEEVERQTELEVAVNKGGMKPINDFSRADTLCLGSDGNRGAVCVGATHHQDMVAAHTLEAGKYIRWKIGAGNMADVLFAICVRPGDANKYMPWVIHVCLLESLSRANVPSFIWLFGGRVYSFLAGRRHLSKFQQHIFDGESRVGVSVQGLHRIVDNVKIA